MSNNHINFNAFVSCRKTRYKEEYTLKANLYFSELIENSKECKGKFTTKEKGSKKFVVKGSDLRALELDIINQVDKFIFSHPLTQGVAMSSLITKNCTYRSVKLLSQITTWNTIRAKK